MTTPDTTTTEPVFDSTGRLTAGHVSRRTTDAIVKFRAMEYLRLKLARAEGELEDAVAALPAGERNAYVDATEKIAASTGETIAAVEDRRARRGARTGRTVR